MEHWWKHKHAALGGTPGSDSDSSSDDEAAGGKRRRRYSKTSRKSKKSRKSRKSRKSKKSKKSGRSRKSGNKWIQFVKKEAAKRGIEYGAALASKSIRAAYHRRK